jgi:hypothetical protein
MKGKIIMKIRYTAILMLILLLPACKAIGPGSVRRDRFDYNTAISNSWKEQTLLNIVKIRYADMPVFVEVASVVSGYTLESSANFAGTLSSNDSIQGDFLSLGAGGKFTDRPTITYAPITGQQFNKSFMNPIPPGAVLFLMQTGWPADLILNVTLDSINGLRSRVTAGANMRPGDPEFYRVIALMREIQKSGAVGMRIIKGEDMQETTVLFFHRKNMTPEVQAAREEVGKLLGLKTGTGEMKVTYGSVPESEGGLAMLTRSMLQIMIELATEVDVPPSHVAEGRTVGPLVQEGGANEEVKPLIRIKSSAEKPEFAFTAVNYRDHWFWIDDRDFKSKRTFAFLMILFSLTETGGREGLPLVTIPTG